MRLKKIELKGFKSFGNATTLHFNEDVVGVVGPNGSGKSNIVDAFRWVLGEQRTSGLRLDKMQDVLFNGTKSRRPANACSVSLIFDNDKGTLPSEYHEVSISRHLYRSGNSEYRLNGVPCRLKDITSLLSDTGIASNSYAIIALDMVDDILSDKDHARRKMFEQAAGISKFKQRKKEVQNKLKASEQDLERVQDLLFEISGNLKELEKQAKKAKSFNKLKEKHKTQRIRLARIEIATLLNSNKTLVQSLEKHRGEQSELKARISKLEAELEKNKQETLKEEEKLNQSQKNAASIANQLKDVESRLNLDRQSLKNTLESNERREDRLRELREQKSKISARMEYLRDQVTAEKKVSLALQESLDALTGQKTKADQEAAKVKGEHDQLLQEVRKLEEQKSEREKQLSVLRSKLDSIEEEGKRLREEEKIEKDKHRELEQALLSVSEAYKALEHKKSECILREEKRKNQLNEQKEKRDAVEEEQKQLERKLDSLKNERDLLKSLLEKLEGYPDSIKHLSAQKEWRKKAVLLSELIYCPDEYRPAIEAVLAPVLDHYVVPDWGTALEGIETLKNAQKGKAQFLLLDALEEESSTKDVKEVGEAVSAIEVVEIDRVYRPLFEFLLKGVYISKAETLPPKSPAEADVLVSSDGQTVRRKNTAEGGSSDLFSGKKIGRKKALEKTNKKISELDKKVDQARAELQQIKVSISKLDTDEIQRELTKIESEIAGVKAREAGIQATRDSGIEAVEKRNRRLNELNEQHREVKTGMSDEEKEIEKLKNSLDSLNKDLENSAKKVEKTLALKGERAEEFNNKNIELIRQQNKLSGFEKELDFQNGRLSDIDDEEKKTGTLIREGEEQIETLKKKTADQEEELQDFYRRKKEVEASLSEKEQQYFSSRNAIFEKEKKVAEIKRKSDDLEEVMTGMREKNREVEFNVKSISERLSVEFGYELDPKKVSLNEEEEKVDVDDLKLKVERLKARLTNFGEVNPLALEAFEEMKVRYDDIQEQKKDIENARDSLRETITEIETTAKERYVEAFDRIRFNFINVFRSLFTEDDNCDLVMTDPETPLDSDIEIIAKPKGKRPQSISQLSGGEKTLTAISLLFALYLLKPAPFCIFDEVDAPLDDSNIEKFNKIIKNFSSESQFIIVTHNKQTMSHLDIIYGVYMEESGVSGVSAVDFRALKNVDFLTDVQEREI